jgi:hypothetical protein
MFLSLHNPGCNAFLDASMQKVEVEQNVNKAQVIILDQTYKTVGKTNVIAIAAIYGGIDAYNKKDLKISTPIKILYIENLTVEVSPNQVKSLVNWKIQF